MPVELLLPGRRISAPKPPSYLALDMAFGVGNPAILGDKSRYNSHGAITTAVPAAGVHGFCLDFDAANPDYVVIPAAHTHLNFIAEPFSLVARVNVESYPDHVNIFVRGVFTVDGWYFRIRNDGRISFWTFQVAAWQRSRSAIGDIVIGNWYTIGFSRAGASARVYINGVDVTVDVGVHINPVTCNRHAVIGVDDNLAANPFDGQIEFLRIFRGIALPTSSHLAWHNALV